MAEVKTKVKLRFTEDYFLSQNNQHYSMVSESQFLEYFLPSNFQYQIVSKDEPADVCIVGIHTISGIRDTEFNLLISIENYARWPWYEHRNKFGETGDSNISAYFYAHHSKFIENDKIIIIPTIHAYINYFLNHEIKFIDHDPKTKFCLMINTSRLNPDILKLTEQMQKNGYRIDSISQYSSQIYGKSCYQSPELLLVLKQYKFILCIENSYMNGYITEKIFNCFMAHTLPLYLGAPNISQFISPESFVDLRKDNWISQVQFLDSNDEAYLKMISCSKIVPDYSNENYSEKLSLRIQKFLTKSPIKKIISFSLWGNHPFYNYGAYENAILAETLFPDWICRFYYFDADPKIISLLEKMKNVELIQMFKSDQNANMFWRFLPAFVEENIILISRDTDSRLNLREKWAVDEWLKSDKNFHVIRDHPLHRTEILGGTWGVRNNLLLPLQSRFENYVRNHQKGYDQRFLGEVVYPFVINTILIHDNYHLYPNEKVERIPVIEDYQSFVGAYCLDVRETSKQLNLPSVVLERPEHLKNSPSEYFYTPK